jgi:hypothetical protein
MYTRKKNREVSPQKHHYPLRYLEPFRTGNTYPKLTINSSF